MRYTGLELFPQRLVVNVAADQHQLIFAITAPVGVVDGKAFARQMEHMAAFLERSLHVQPRPAPSRMKQGGM